MKYVLLLVCFALITYNGSAQTPSSTNDTTVWGNVKTNYPGGASAYMKFITDNAHYPASEFNSRIMGCSYIRFTIDKDGSLTNVRVYAGAGPGMNDEALRVIKGSGKWIPGKMNGAPVRTKCFAPVYFVLGDANKGSVVGTARDSLFLSSAIKLESNRVPLSEASGYVNKTISFIGKVYGTKTQSDTVFIMSCGDINYNTPMNYLNVVLMGKEIQTVVAKTRFPAIIKGMGKVINYNGTPLIIIADRNKVFLTNDIPPMHPN